MNAELAATASSAPDTGDTPALEVLTSRVRALIDSEWCGRMMRIERVDPQDVSRECLNLVSSLKPESGLFQTTLSYLESQRIIAAHPRWPRSSILTSITLAALLLAAAAWSLLANTWWPIGVVTYSLFLLGFMPWWLRDRHRRRSGLDDVLAKLSQTSNDLDQRLRTIIEGAVRTVTQVEMTTPSEDHVTLEAGAYLSSRVTEEERIGTRSRSAVELHLLRSGGAAVGVTGERGVGKSELLRSFLQEGITRPTVKNGGTIGVFVAVPAAFDGIDFLRLTLRRLAEAVPGAEEVARRIAHRQTLAAMALYILGSLVFLAGVYLVVGLFTMEQLLQFLRSDSTENWDWSLFHAELAIVVFGSSDSVDGPHSGPPSPTATQSCRT